MVNEEDQLRLQVMRSGLALDLTWYEIDHIDDLLELLARKSEELGS